MPTVLLRNIKKIVGILDPNAGFKKGKEMKDLSFIEDAFILFDNKIIDFGPMSLCPEHADSILDASGKFVLPAWCDSHTHIVFAGSREMEFRMRLQGHSYEEIAANGGGILNSAEKIQGTSHELLLESALHRLHEVSKTGTGAIEIKSGYGLTAESEIKMLRVIQELKKRSPVRIKSTFLGAHAIPKAFMHNRQGYIDQLINIMLPIIAEEQLADYIDVFCDFGFFTPEETDQILQAGAKYGLKPKIHANELGISGGVQAGIRNNAISVDHLERIGEEEIEALQQSQTIPTLLPNVSFFLDIPFAPARKMIDTGLGIALASDYNPGSSPSGNIPLLLAIACHRMQLWPEETINAVTINGACAMEIQQMAGSITIGKDASLILTETIPDISYMMYAFGKSHIEKVWIGGQLV